MIELFGMIVRYILNVCVLFLRSDRIDFVSMNTQYNKRVIFLDLIFIERISALHKETTNSYLTKMSDEIEKHVAKKFEICQRVGKGVIIICL